MARERDMFGNRIQLPGPNVPQQQPVMQIASPLNDVQLVSLMAAQLGIADPKEAVARAVQIVAQAIYQASPGKLAKAFEAIQNANGQE